jgi:hypothetical protein
MSDSGDPDVTRLLRDLTRELQTLKREVDADRSGGMSTRKQLSRFTSEVAIPSLVLLLETNIRALKLLRRTIRLAEGREPRRQPSPAAEEVRDRAQALGTQALSRLDETLAAVQSSLDEENADQDVYRLLTEARSLQEQVSEQLAVEEQTETDGSDDSTTGTDASEREPVDIDIDAELETLKDNLEDGKPDGPSGADGSDSAAGGSEDGPDGSGSDTA